MYAISYLELNICWLIIMMLILHKQVRGLDKRLTSQTFTELIISAMVYVFLDMIYGLQQNAVIHLSVTVSKIVNVMMFIFIFFWWHFAFLQCFLKRSIMHFVESWRWYLEWSYFRLLQVFCKCFSQRFLLFVLDWHLELFRYLRHFLQIELQWMN